MIKKKILSLVLTVGMIFQGGMVGAFADMESEQQAVGTIAVQIEGESQTEMVSSMKEALDKVNVKGGKITITESNSTHNRLDFSDDSYEINSKVEIDLNGKDLSNVPKDSDEAKFLYIAPGGDLTIKGQGNLSLKALDAGGAFIENHGKLTLETFFVSMAESDGSSPTVAKNQGTINIKEINGNYNEKLIFLDNVSGEANIEDSNLYAGISCSGGEVTLNNTSIEESKPGNPTLTVDGGTVCIKGERSSFQGMNPIITVGGGGSIKIENGNFSALKSDSMTLEAANFHVKGELKILKGKFSKGLSCAGSIDSIKLKDFLDDGCEFLKENDERFSDEETQNILKSTSNDEIRSVGKKAVAVPPQQGEGNAQSNVKITNKTYTDIYIYTGNNIKNPTVGDFLVENGENQYLHFSWYTTEDYQGLVAKDKMNGSPVDVGKYILRVEYAEDDNNVQKTKDIPIVIVPAELKISYVTLKDKYYDGKTEAEVNGITVINEGIFLDKDKDYTATAEFKEPNAGENKEVVVKLKWSDELKKNINWDGHEIEYIKKDGVIKKAALKDLSAEVNLSKDTPNYTYKLDLSKVNGFPEVWGNHVKAEIEKANYNGITSVNLDKDGKTLILVADNVKNSTQDKVIVKISGLTNYTEGKITVNVKYTDKAVAGGGGGAGGGAAGGTSETKTTKGNVKETIKLDSKIKNGVLQAELSEKNVTDAIKSAQAKAEKEKKDNKKISIEVKLEGNKAEELSVGFAKKAIEKFTDASVKDVTLTSSLVTSKFDLNMLKTLQKKADADISFRVEKADSKKFTKETKELIGSRPSYDFSLIGKNNKEITDFGNGKVAITIPYTLGKNETASKVAAYYINEKGKAEKVKNSEYDAKTKKLTFETDHFSVFAVGYKSEEAAKKEESLKQVPVSNSQTFTDINNHWARNEIKNVTEKGLFTGTEQGKFSPDKSMTRGMFVTVLGRLAKADVSEYKKSTFSDVKTNAYYMGYIEWAVKNNIVKGIGEGEFAPEQPISREQMAVIITNYAKATGLELKKVNAEIYFADNDRIEGYAKEAVKNMQTAGIIKGRDGNLFEPKGTATRAEVSAVITRIM